MQNIYSYDKNSVLNHSVVIWGIDERAKDLAVQMINYECCFDYFVVNEKEFSNTKLFNKPVINVEELCSIRDYCIVVPHENQQDAVVILKQYGLCEKVVDFERINPKISNAKNVVIYGTGATARRCYNSIKESVTICCFADSNEKMIGKHFMGIPVHSISQMLEVEEPVIIIGSQYFTEIKANLLSIGIKEEQLFFDEGQFLDKISISDEIFFGNSVIINTKKIYGSIVALIDDYETYGDFLLFGEGNIVCSLKRKMNILGIPDEKIALCEVNDTQNDIFQLMYENLNNKICIICSKNTDLLTKKIQELKIDVSCLRWVNNYTLYYRFDFFQTYSMNLDPIIGMSCNETDEEIPGFVKYSWKNENEQSVKILVLGGSCCSSYGVLNESWVSILSDILRRKKISHILYNGSAITLHAGQELFKLIRDGMLLKPDVVISYSGVNNIYPTIPNHPYYKSYHKDLYDSLKQNIAQHNLYSENAGLSVRGVNFGVSDERSGSEYWYDMTCFMKTLCEEKNIKFYSILQPNIFTKKNYSKRELSVLAMLGFLQTNGELKNMSDGGKNIKNASDKFYGELRRIDYPIFMDYTDIFNEADVFFDSCHIKNAGNRILAERIYHDIFENNA